MQEIPKNKNLIPKSENNVEVSVQELPRLRPKLRKLCEELLKDTPRIEAHKIAGFKAKTDEARSQAVCDYLTKPDVSKYIAVRENQIAEQLRKETNVSKAWVLNNLIYVVEKCKGEKPRELVAAIAEINKMLGYNAPTEIKNTISKGLDLSNVSQEFIEKYVQLMDEYEAIQQGKIETVEAVEMKQIPESVLTVKEADKQLEYAKAEIEPETPTVQPEQVDSQK